jgi:two-component system, OmpR family, phosphate regulon sensor histidine kinase PhoR
MNRKIFISLVVMMSLSIIGITMVQITWIRNAVRTTNESFDNAVFISLNNAVEEIESLRKMNSFNNYLWNEPSMIIDSLNGITGYLNYGSYTSQSGGNVSINVTRSIESVDSDGKRRQVIITKDTSYVDSVHKPGRNFENRSPYSLLNENKTSSGISDAIRIEQKDFLEWVRKRANEFRNISARMLYEIYTSEKSTELTNSEIAGALNHFFPYYNIRTPYKFAVIKDGKVISDLDKKGNENDFLRSPYKVRMFSDNLIQQNMVLSVVFPERTNYVLGSMAWILGGSMLFSLFIFATFALSLYFILRQKKISEIKSDFINNMTHEFKTPIATISLAADTITNPKVISDEKSVRHFVSMIKKENNRMNKQVETILQIASLDKKEIDFKYEKTPLHSIIEKAIETIEIQVHQKGGKIRTSLEATENIVMGDAEHLTNLVHNLLDNAIKYSPEYPDITISTVNRDGGIVMAVSDRGIGMSRSVQSKIFERFYRQASGDIHDVKGFGLGLNYVKAIVDAHKGIITVTSEPGKGSRFEIYLPVNTDNVS